MVGIFLFLFLSPKSFPYILALYLQIYFPLTNKKEASKQTPGVFIFPFCYQVFSSVTSFFVVENRVKSTAQLSR